jgi:hypothetical protein
VHNAVAAIGSTASVNAQIARARELADGLSYKAGLFFEGLHWWLRGRYGEGPDVGGLAKSPEALVSDAALFGIYMPTETPQPSDPSDARVKRATPRFDRRHHYWWTWEDRRLQRGKLSSSIISNEQEKFSVTMHAFW